MKDMSYLFQYCITCPFKKRQCIGEKHLNLKISLIYSSIAKGNGPTDYNFFIQHFRRLCGSWRRIWVRSGVSAWTWETSRVSRFTRSRARLPAQPRRARTRARTRRTAWCVWRSSRQANSWRLCPVYTCTTSTVSTSGSRWVTLYRKNNDLKTNRCNPELGI